MRKFVFSLLFLSALHLPVSVQAGVFCDQAMERLAQADSVTRGEWVKAVVQKTMQQEFADVGIQQEHEIDDILRGYSKESKGNVFEFYRPTEVRKDLVAEVLAGRNWLERAIFKIRNFFLRDAFRAFSVEGKILYLAAFEAAVVVEKGQGSAWKGNSFLLLEKTPSAPTFIAANPMMEPVPAQVLNDPTLMARYGKHPAARFLFPEIITDRYSPSKTVNEAIFRARRIIQETGHSGMHYHVFVQVDPLVLRKNAGKIGDLMQTMNDLLYERAVAESEGLSNAMIPTLYAWHSARSEKIKEVTKELPQDPLVPNEEDLGNTKFAFLGWRYWGLSDGKAVISFELRKEGSVLRKNIKDGFRGDGVEITYHRDWSATEKYLSALVLIADALAKDTLPSMKLNATDLNIKKIDQMVIERALEMQIPAKYVVSPSQLFHILGTRERNINHPELGTINPSLLLPLAKIASTPQIARTEGDMEFLKKFIEFSNHIGRFYSEDQALPYVRNHLYELSEIYKYWARQHQKEDEFNFDNLIIHLGNAAAP